MSLSKHSFIGRLTRDPEVKYIPVSGEQVAVANFAVAVDAEYGEGTDYYDVVAWRKQAETIGKYLAKGRMVYVEGRPKKRSYNTTKDGVEFTVNVYEVHADKVQFLDRGQQTEGQGQPQAQTQEQATYTGPAPF